MREKNEATAMATLADDGEFHKSRTVILLFLFLQCSDAISYSSEEHKSTKAGKEVEK